jgi:ribosomal protein S18 acetylase RimI-like enzyme
MSPDPIEIRRATRERVPALAAMLARAFSDDPMIAVSIASDDREERMRRFFTLIDEDWAALGALFEVGDAHGAAAWLPPGHSEALADQNAAKQEAFHALSPDGGVKHDALWDWIEEEMPDEPVWYLDQIGVDPDRQGTGIGSALITFGLDRARADEVPAFLETAIAANVGYYERFGFRVTLHDDAPLGGPHIWFMRWEP